MLTHVMALLEAGHQVTLVAAARDDNRAAMSDTPSQFSVLLAPTGTNIVRRSNSAIVRQIRPALPEPALVRAARCNDECRKALSTADLVEYHWTENAYLWRYVSQHRPAIPSVAVCHDVLQQRYDRRYATISRRHALRRIGALAVRQTVAHDEPAMLRHMSALITFSEKDRLLLSAKVPEVRATRVRPGLFDASVRVPRKSQTTCEVVFVGAFARQENDDAAHWLLTEIWPQVAARVPHARLFLVGPGASARLRTLAAQVEGASLTGYVDDLAGVYARASLAVVPLREGAGVKFKTIEALASGVPLVATRIGVEGIFSRGEQPPGLICDDGDSFADAICKVLLDPEPFCLEAEAVAAVVRKQFDRAVFAETLDTLYRRLVA
jgi:glycosyltransferase involved in cell wall biosynthesis